MYAVFLYGVFGIFAVYVRDFLLFRYTKFSGTSQKKHPANAFYLLIFTKIAYAIFSYVIPMLCLPFDWWQTLLIYFSALAISGAIIVLMLVIPHINSDSQNTLMEHSNPKGNEWVRHQAKSTTDYSINSFWINWFTGGLNTHLIHHLFPNICHTHYRRLTPIIKSTLEEYGINYKNKSLSKAIVDHFRFLESVGKDKQPRI
jgi:linoleoyl-CoA desaturase